MAIITYPLNGIDYDAENAETYLCTRTSGVYSADENFQASVTGDRQVSISKGLAWIQNADFAGKSVCNTESVAVEIPIADGTRPRIDRIVLRFDKAANVSSIVLRQGTPSSTPAAPAVERTELVYELGLCTVNVPAASTIVSAGDVTSTLLDETVCGLMRDGVTGIPTAQLQEQVIDLIDNLRDVIAGVEAGSEVMLKATYGGSEDGVVKSADKLQTARKIGLANFDGTADITVDQMGAVPKTGGEFSDVVRFYGPNYPQIGFMTATNNSGGLYFAVCGEDRKYKDYIIKSLLSGTKISTSLNGESTQNIPKKAKVISNWKSITESGFYFAAAGSTGNPVSGVAFMGFVFVYEGNNHFGIGRACQGDGSTNHLYFTNGFSIASLKWVQM